VTAVPAAVSHPITRPAEGEFLPFYARYVARVPEGDILAILAEQMGETLALLRSVPAERSLHRYAPGKWSVRDLVQHVADTERVMSYRLLRIARGDSTPLAGFAENDWAGVAQADRRDWLELVDELEAVRAATIALIRGIDAEAAMRRGTANGAEVTVRALAYIIAGHELHHVAILRERYL
jgi:hypothetical protein